MVKNAILQVYWYGGQESMRPHFSMKIGRQLLIEVLYSAKRTETVSKSSINTRYPGKIVETVLPIMVHRKIKQISSRHPAIHETRIDRSGESK